MPNVSLVAATHSAEALLWIIHRHICGLPSRRSRGTRLDKIVWDVAIIREKEWPIGRDEASLFLSSDGMMVVAPLPENHFRIAAAISQGDLRRLMKNRYILVIR